MPTTLSTLISASLGPKALVGIFVRNQCTIGDGLRIPKDELHAEFLAWAKRNGRPITMTLPAFGHYLMGGHSIAPRRTRAPDGSRQWVYERIALNEY